MVEDFSCLNNAVGDLTIGDYTRVGLRNTIIGPVNIGNHVNLAQNVTVTGLNQAVVTVLVMRLVNRIRRKKRRRSRPGPRHGN